MTESNDIKDFPYYKNLTKTNFMLYIKILC